MDSLQELATPFGMLRCLNKDYQPIPFQTTCIEKQYSTAVYDEICERWTSVKPEYQSNIIIRTDELRIGESYIIRLDGDYSFGFGASDENSISNVITYNDCTLSFGAYDPNDDGKDRQAVPYYKNGVRIGFKPPEQYDISEFRGYLLNVLPDWSGFVFQLLDRTMPEVRFRIAWIKHDESIVTDDVYYENAIYVITTL